MATRVEIFHNSDSARLQGQINDFLTKHQGIEIIDIKYQHVIDGRGDNFYSALVIYA